MRSVVRTMRLKPSTENTVGGKTSRSSLTTNARRRDLGMNGFLSTRDRMSGVRLELTNPTPKVLRYLHGRQSTPVNLQQQELLRGRLLKVRLLKPVLLIPGL